MFLITKNRTIYLPPEIVERIYFFIKQKNSAKKIWKYWRKYRRRKLLHIFDYSIVYGRLDAFFTFCCTGRYSAIIRMGPLLKDKEKGIIKSNLSLLNLPHIVPNVYIRDYINKF